MANRVHTLAHQTAGFLMGFESMNSRCIVVIETGILTIGPLLVTILDLFCYELMFTHGGRIDFTFGLLLRVHFVQQPEDFPFDSFAFSWYVCPELVAKMVQRHFLLLNLSPRFCLYGAPFLVTTVALENVTVLSTLLSNVLS